MRRRGATITEMIGLLAVALAVGAMLVPVLAGGRRHSLRFQSMENLRELSAAQVCYAADWGDRQYTAAPDDYATYGGECDDFEDANGYNLEVLLGWNHGHPDCAEPDLGLWGYYASFGCGNEWVAHPLHLNPQYTQGVFRLPNAWPLHEYVAAGTGRVYDPVFYAPDDEPSITVAAPAFDLPCEHVPFLNGFDLVPSSYCFSPAAMYHPDVFRPVAEGGYRAPASFGDAFASPSMSQVRHADLKTRLMEYHWIDGAPTTCHAGLLDPFPIGDCSPWHFNHGAAAAPATVFFDGSIELFATFEARAGDQRVLALTGGLDGLWSRDTPFGPTGYFGDLSVDGTVVSHHILTTSGILGRDRLHIATLDGGEGGSR